MNNDQRAFERDFGAGFRALAGKEGPCPTAERLAAFLDGEDPNGRIGRHVAVCGVCDALVERTRACEDATDDAAPLVPSGARARLPTPAVRVKRLLRNPAFAYSVAALTCFLWLVASPARQPAVPPAAPPDRGPAPAVSGSPPPALSPLVVFDLNGVRGAGGAVQVPNGARVAFSFVVPQRPGFRYQAALLDDSGRVLAESAVEGCDRLGNCQLVVEPELHSRARLLRVTETTAGTGTAARRFEYPVPR